jgi:SulP family sulfate permease
MVLAAFLFMKRMSEVTNIQMVSREFGDDRGADEDEASAALRLGLPDGVTIFEINGPFFFGAAQTFREHVESVLGRPKVLILRMRNVPAMDSTGLHTLREVAHRGRRDGTLVLLADVHAQPMVALARSEALEVIGEQHVFDDLDKAIECAREHLARIAALPRGTGPTTTVGTGPSRGLRPTGSP